MKERMTDSEKLASRQVRSEHRFFYSPRTRSISIVIFGHLGLLQVRESLIQACHRINGRK